LSIWQLHRAVTGGFCQIDGCRFAVGSTGSNAFFSQVSFAKKLAHASRLTGALGTYVAFWQSETNDLTPPDRGRMGG
jgi:hypothetical protein